MALATYIIWPIYFQQRSQSLEMIQVTTIFVHSLFRFKSSSAFVTQMDIQQLAVILIFSINHRFLHEIWDFRSINLDYRRKLNVLFSGSFSGHGRLHVESRSSYFWLIKLYEFLYLISHIMFKCLFHSFPLQGSICNDCFTLYFCYSCALAQMAREIRATQGSRVV